MSEKNSYGRVGLKCQLEAEQGKGSTPYDRVGHKRAYFACPKKRQLRQFIMDCWRTFSGQHQVPANREYWTLCGPMAIKGEGLHPGCELQQLAAKDFLSARQFVGVERDDETHAMNLAATVRTYVHETGPTLYNGDIIDVMLRCQHQGHFAPAIVHLDSISEPKAALPLLSSTLNILNEVDGPTMVVWGVLTERRYPRRVSHDWDAMYDDLVNDDHFTVAYRHGWDMYPEHPTSFDGLQYESTTATQMSYYVFVRRQIACGESCQCWV